MCKEKIVTDFNLQTSTTQFVLYATFIYPTSFSQWFYRFL